MRKLIFKMITISEVIAGSGEGWGSTIDSDIVFDEYGLPYIPARRIKGCLRESAIEVAEMFKLSSIDNQFEEKVNGLFGRQGEKECSPVLFRNLYLKDYELNRTWFQWGIQEYPSIISSDAILNTFSTIRQQTAIDDSGVAEDKSLRTIRVLRRNILFEGELHVIDNSIDIEPLCLAVINLKNIGSKRNRGFGHISCSLLDETGKELTKSCVDRIEQMEAS